MSDAIDELGALLKEAGAVVYWVPPDHKDCRSVISGWAYKANQLNNENERLRACIERCKAVQEQTAAKAAGARAMAVDGANDELTRSRVWSASIAYDQSATQLAKALEGF